MGEYLEMATGAAGKAEKRLRRVWVGDELALIGGRGSATQRSRQNLEAARERGEGAAGTRYRQP